MRNDIIENPDIDILILQIQTGCEGLNLQHYSDIYFVSPHWNPSVEDQAVARAHRLGQTKLVNVYRFVMEDPSARELDTRELDTEKEGSIPSINIETYCLNVQSKKRELHI
jgi:SNF2 family DNA or RNA helicase